MTTKVSTPRPIEIKPGVQPSTDWTNAATGMYTYTRAIRFVHGIPKKIGGWISQTFNYGLTISGYVRTIFTDFISGKLYAIIGSNEKLYSLIGSTLTNITPLNTTTIPIANSLATQYDTLSNNPFSSVSGSPVLTVTDADAARFKPGDIVYYSGATGFAGILAGAINGDNIIREVRTGEYDINVGTNANATTTGGGAAVVRSSGLINVTDTAHGQSDGDRVKITGAANTGGILAADINKEFIIRNVATDDFDIMTAGNAASSVTAGGGAATEYQQEIPIGNVNEVATQGYGAGLYGVGLYGTALTSSSARSFPRIWFVDRYANTLIMTPGQQGKLYQWDGDVDAAPAVISGSPSAVNYAFISNGICVTFGANGVENAIETSDQNNITEWTSSSTNQVFIDDIEGAGRLLSHCPSNDLNLIFTENKTYTFRYIGLPLVWEILPLDDTVGIIAPMARVSAKGIAFWMGTDNFYMYRGGKVEIIEANTQGESTCLRYVFDNLNWGQKSKIFAQYNPKYNEVWFFYPSAASNEPDRVVKVCLADFTWSIDQWPDAEGYRTAAEWPSVKTKNPYMANVSTLYKHEFGTDADGQPLAFALTGPKLYNGKDNLLLTSVIPDSNQDGTVTFTATGYRYPQSSTPTYTTQCAVDPSTEFVPIQSSARYYQYQWEGEELGQAWQMGVWYDNVQQGPTQ